MRVAITRGIRFIVVNKITLLLDYFVSVIFPANRLKMDPTGWLDDENIIILTAVLGV